MFYYSTVEFSFATFSFHFSASASDTRSQISSPIYRPPISSPTYRPPDLLDPPYALQPPRATPTGNISTAAIDAEIRV